MTVMTRLACERRHRNTIRIDDHLDIQFHRAPIEPNHDMAYSLPDDGVYPLHFLLRDKSKQQLDPAKHMGLYLHMPRTFLTSIFT
jgi:hypothetical protein